MEEGAVVGVSEVDGGVVVVSSVGRRGTTVDVSEVEAASEKCDGGQGRAGCGVRRRESRGGSRRKGTGGGW